MIWFKDRRGITLVELILALALMGIILVTTYNLLSVGLNSFEGQATSLDNQARARRAMRDISQEIRKAESVTIEDNFIELDHTSYRFNWTSNILLKNDKEFVTGIQSFNASWEGNRVVLEITTLARTGRETTLSTSIYIRE